MNTCLHKSFRKKKQKQKNLEGRKDGVCAKQKEENVLETTAISQTPQQS